MGLGILGDILFFRSGFGLNAAIWTLALVIAGAVLFRKAGVDASRQSLWLLGPTLVFAVGFAVHDSFGMALVNSIGLAVSLTFLTTHLRDKAFGRISILDSTLGAAVAWMAYVVDVFAIWIEDVQWKTLGAGLKAERIAPVVRGLLFAVPLVVVFGMLMASADAVFQKMAANAFQFDAWATVQHVFLIGFFLAVAIALLRRAYLTKPFEISSGASLSPPPPSGATEALIVVGALDLLFAVFVSIQFRYLFGGTELVTASTGLNYATYARRGFFELVTITALALPVLLVCTSHALQAAPRLKQPFKILSLTMVSMLVVVMVSAVQRMAFYVNESGLSELRLYTTAFMGWIAMVYVIYCVTFVKSRPERFSYFSLAAGLAVCIGLNMLRPGTFIADYNVQASKRGTPLDVAYLSKLGADGVPGLMRAWPNLTPSEKKTSAVWLRDESTRWTTDWRAWNMSRSRAKSLIDARSAELATLAPPNTEVASYD